MKRIILPICILALFLISPLVPGALEGSNLDIELAGQSPIPVEPGNNVELDIQIENTGFGEAKEVIVEIRPEYPFTLITGDRTKEYTSISPESSVKSSYTLYVDDSAISNTYEVEFIIYSNKTPIATISKKIPVSVMGNPKLILTDVQVTPKDIEPGSTVIINAKIKNVGTGKVSYMEVNLNSSSSYLVPVLSKGTVYIGELNPGEEMEMNFEINVDISAEYKTYMTSLTTDYRDENNEEKQTIFDIGIPVKGTISLNVIKIEANHERGKVRIEVANKGTSEAKSLEAKLIINGETIGIDYLTNLKANKHTTFDFPLVYNGSGQLVIDYIGPGIEENQVIMDMVLNFESPDGGNDSLLAGAVGVIIILVVIYLVFRKLKKKK